MNGSKKYGTRFGDDMYVLYNHKYYLIHNAIKQYYVRKMEELFK